MALPGPNYNSGAAFYGFQADRARHKGYFLLGQPKGGDFGPAQTDPDVDDTSGDARAWAPAVGLVDPATGLSLVERTAMAVNPRGAGCVASATFTPVAAAYSALDIIDTIKEFAFTYADGTPVPSGALIRLMSTTIRIGVGALESTEGAYVLKTYTSSPAAPQADNAAFSAALADIDIFAGPISLGTPVDEGAITFFRQVGIDTEIKLTGTSLFGYLQTVPGFTATAAVRKVAIRGMVV